MPRQSESERRELQLKAVPLSLSGVQVRGESLTVSLAATRMLISSSSIASRPVRDANLSEHPRRWYQREDLDTDYPDY
jgi:hypothetical protein